MGRIAGLAGPDWRAGRSIVLGLRAAAPELSAPEADGLDADSAALVLTAALGPAARPATAKLLVLLGDDEWLMRNAAVYALSEIAPDNPAVQGALGKLLNDPEDQVRNTARKFLRALEDGRE